MIFVLINDERVDQIARAIHANFRIDQSRHGSALGVASAMIDWANLDEDKREANRAQARDIVVKLDLIGCRVAEGRLNRRFAFTADELETLARHEQIRWSSQRTAAGWVYGPHRDDGAKVHPCLVSWDELPEYERDKDRDAVRHIPDVLAAAGLRIVRRHAGDHGYLGPQ